MMHGSPPDNLFLAPPHSHDPSHVSHVAALPSSLLYQVPPTVQEALWTLQESTSIIYASYMRLQELFTERFERLIELPVKPGATTTRRYSEGAFFTYVNQFTAERGYMLEDAHPDWKHKASRVGLQQYGDLVLTFRGKEMTMREWFFQLQAAESFWIQGAQDMELPEFESTVLEYHSQSSTPASDTASEGEGEDVMGDPVSTGRKVVGASGLGLGVAKVLEEL